MLLKIRAKTGAKREVVTKVSEDKLQVSVKELAENNSANDRIIEILKQTYPGRSVRFIKGHHSPGKIFEIGD